MKSILYRLRSFFDRIFFTLRYPYVSAEKIHGLSSMQLPFVFRGGRRIHLSAEDSTLKEKVNISIQSKTWFGQDVEISTHGSSQVKIKSETTIQDRCKILGNVTLERFCVLAPQIFISSGTHNAFNTPYLTIREQDRLGPDTSQTTYNHVEEDCWIGFNVFIKPGVYIGRGAVIGANAVVSRNVAPYEVIVGHHRVIKKRLEFSPPAKIEITDKSHKPYFYRAIGESGQLISDDNLIVLKRGNAQKIRIQGEGLNQITLIQTPVGIFRSIESKDNKNRIYQYESGTSSKTEFPAILDSYLCLNIQYKENTEIKIESVEAQ